MEKWQDDPIPFDYIDTAALFAGSMGSLPRELFEEEDDGEIPLVSQNFGVKVMKDRKSIKSRTWQDLGIFERFHPDSKRDPTLLAALYASLTDLDTVVPLHMHPQLEISDFLSVGYDAHGSVFDKESASADMMNDSIVGNHPGDFSLNSTELVVPSSTSFNINRALSGNSATNPIQTPRPTRRQNSVDRNFQTPITRIIR